MNRETRRLLPPILAACVLIPHVCAAPGITAIANAASNIYFNAPLAQGCIFIIKGSGLGPANLSTASVPFRSTNLNGSSVAVTVGSTTVNALMYYTSSTQLAALLPSNTPTGVASFIVTYNGQSSASVNQGIVMSNLGLFTLDSSGQGPAIVSYPDYTLVSAVKAPDCGAPGFLEAFSDFTSYAGFVLK